MRASPVLWLLAAAAVLTATHAAAWEPDGAAQAAMRSSGAWAALNWRKAARFFSTKSAKFPSKRKSLSCVCFKSANSSASVETD